MTNIGVYDTTATTLEDIAERLDVTVAELVEAMLDCFADNGEGYI